MDDADQTDILLQSIAGKAVGGVCLSTIAIDDEFRPSYRLIGTRAEGRLRHIDEICPVSTDRLVEVVLSNGARPAAETAASFSWERSCIGGGMTVVAYRYAPAHREQ